MLEESNPNRLAVSGLSAWYGGAQVLFDVDLDVSAQGVTALIGRNGAGKTSTLRGIMGLMPRIKGDVTYSLGQREYSLRGLTTVAIARLGIGYVPDNRRIFPDMTVLENLEMGRFLARGGREPVGMEEIFETFPLLKGLSKRSGGVLSGGEQQLLAIARTMVGRPRLLLLDEPSEGLAPVIVDEVRAALELLCDAFDVSILLVEQNFHFAQSLASSCVILDNGRAVFSGSTDELRGKDELIGRYLGV